MKMIESKNIELFKNLSQIYFDNKFYDFHNDYDCIEIRLIENNELTLKFKNILGDIVYMKFFETQVKSLEFCNNLKTPNLTIDNIYRGRTEILDEVIDLKNDVFGYFYLEFYEGNKLTFWSKGYEIIDNINNRS